MLDQYKMTLLMMSLSHCVDFCTCSFQIDINTKVLLYQMAVNTKSLNTKVDALLVRKRRH